MTEQASAAATGATATEQKASGNGTAKMVPESDLLAVKADYEGKLTVLASEKDKHYQSLLQTQTERDGLRAKITGLEGEVAKLKPLTERIPVLEQEITTTRNLAVTATQARLAQVYTVDPSKLTGKSLAELTLIEEGLKLGSGRATGRFDTGTGGQASSGAGGLRELIDRSKGGK